MKNFFVLILFLVSNTSFAQFNEYHPEVNWFTIDRENFAVHFHDGADRTAKVVAKIVDEIYEPLTSFYGYKPDKVHFVIKDIDDYANGATYFFDNKIEIWATPLDTDLRGTHNWLRNVISHEFTHMIQLQAAMKAPRTLPAFYFQWLNYEDERRPDVLYGFPNLIISYPVPMINVPPWFAEGTAQYMRKEFNYDFWDSHRDMILREYVMNGRMLTWNEMSVFDKTSLGNESVYNSGFALVKYIAEKYGEAKLIEINNNLRSGFSFTIDAAIKKSLGISGPRLYEEWRDHLNEDYKLRTQNIRQKIVKGEKIESEGFGNFYPIFSPDEKKIYYISNKNADYFLTSIYEYDIDTKQSKLIQPGVASTLAITEDGSKLIYSKLTEKNKNWASIHDIYVYDLITEEETRLTHGLRANNPSLSHDGKKIVFIFQKDGTINIGSVDTDGKNFSLVTSFSNGEQVFNPKYSSDDSFVVFDYSMNGSRDIARIDLDGSDFNFILSSADVDERNPVMINDSILVYSADEAGIFNLFKYNLNTSEKKQLTNVLGSVFMPTVSQSDQIVYAGYESSGYKIFLLKSIHEDDFSNFSYLSPTALNANRNNSFSSAQSTFDWQRLRNFDDSVIPEFEINDYKGSFTKLAFIPFIRFDNYNKKAKGIQLLKPGVYFYSSDMLNRFNIFGSVAINTRWERDIFVSLEYRDRIPGLYSLGLKPEISLQGFNVSRTSENVIGLFPDTVAGVINYGLKIPIEVGYNLLEFDLIAKHPIFTKQHNLEFKFVYSRYEAIIGSFLLPGNLLYPTTRDIYLKGFNFGVAYRFENFHRTKDMDINPYGTKIDLQYEYSTNDFNPEEYYDESSGTLITRFEKTNFNRLELNLLRAFKLPAWKHSLSIQLRAGITLGPQTDDFFDFYLGGLIGMKSYPFYSISGNEFAHVSLTYRFPLFENIDARFGHFYIDKIYASFSGDFGNAWNGTSTKLKDFKKGVGGEIRLQLNSFYLFPTSIFFNASYAFDEFLRENSFTKETITYGKEWRLYFGILFGFDF
ncbi:MAG: biopolymer transporter Tol [Bacteroidetes bacterium]|nr:biopolymer transporter Tol [Bacteroidota bacterium]MBU2585071.1 biopolymer transporter Tol [Bacteroidota bacterium]